MLYVLVKKNYQYIIKNTNKNLSLWSRFVLLIDLVMDIKKKKKKKNQKNLWLEKNL